MALINSVAYSNNKTKQKLNQMVNEISDKITRRQQEKWMNIPKNILRPDKKHDGYLKVSYCKLIKSSDQKIFIRKGL